MAVRDQRRALSRFHRRRRRQRAGACPSAPRRGAERAGAQGSGTSRTCSAFREAERLAERLCAATFADLVFFCNSGAEAMECAIKVARKYQYASAAGRSVTASSRSKAPSTAARWRRSPPADRRNISKASAPWCEGFDQVPFGDLDAVKAAIGPETAAILIEPIQGEGGVRVVPTPFLRGAARTVRPARPAAGLRRGADRHRPHRQLLRLSALRRDARRDGRSPRRSAAAFRSAPASPPRRPARA